MNSKHKHCCLAILLTGLAFALEELCSRVEVKNPKMRAFIFSLESKEVERYISEALDSFVDLGAQEHEWVWLRVAQYLEHPLFERENFLREAQEYFENHKIWLHEDSLEYNALLENGRHLGKQVYEENRAFFIYLSTFFYDEWLKNGLSGDHHIVFFTDID